jgi:molybdopterin-guanine dinucleotide biosynthesis protein B
MRAVAVIGFKDSGKTALAERIIHRLKARNLRVAVVKHAHGGLTPPLKDSGRLFNAGADLVVTVAEGAVEEYRRYDAKLWEVISQVRAYDFAVFEGFKSEFPGARIAVAGDAEEARQLTSPLTVAIVGPRGRIGGGFSVPIFDPVEDADKIVDYVLEKAFEPLPGLNCGFCRYGDCLKLAEAIARGEATHKECTVFSSKVRLRVDGKSIELNPFVQEVFRNVILALASTLKGTPPNPSTVEVRVER